MLVAKLRHFWTSVSPSLTGLCKERHLGNVTLCSALPSPTTALPPLPAPLPRRNSRPQTPGDAMIRNICRRSWPQG